jgi:hypothetical protein
LSGARPHREAFEAFTLPSRISQKGDPRRAGCNPTLDGHFVPFLILLPSLDKATACSSNVLDMTFRIFSQTDPDYEVFQDQPRDLSVGKVYKVKRKSDGKVRHHYRRISSSGKDSLFSRRNN